MMTTAKLAYSLEELEAVQPGGRTTLFGEIRDGRLKARKLGRRTIVLAADAVAWLESLPKREADEV